MKFMTVVKIVVGLVIALIITGTAILFTMDFSAYKGEITKAVKDATGRELVIEGEFSPKIGLTPAIAVEKVRFANAPWGSRKQLATIESFRAEIELLPIFFGNIRIKQIVLSGADILLETRADGVGNWVVEGAKEAPEKPEKRGGLTIPEIDKVLIEKAVLVYKDGVKKTTTTVKIDNLGASAPAHGPLNVDLTGSYNGETITLKGAIDSLSKMAAGKALGVDLTAKAGGAAIGVKGTIAQPQKNKGIKLDISAEGESLATLSALAGSPVPDIGPYKISATVADKGAAWDVKGLRLQVGESDLSGNLSVNPTVHPISVTAALTSTLLRLSDFQDKNAKPAEDSKKPSAKANDGRVFPNDPLPLDGLKAANAQLSFNGQKIEGPALLLTDVLVNLKLRNGNLVLRPVSASYGTAKLSTDFSLATSTGTPQMAAKLAINGLDLAEVIKQAGSPGLLTGRLNVNADVSGRGGSVRAIMAGLNGTIIARMNEGKIQNELLDFLSADVLKAISPWSKGDDGIKIACIVGDYQSTNGKLKSRATVVDTNRLAVVGDGGVDLGTEKIDFGLVPHAQNASLMQLLVPLKVGGTLASPSVLPDAARMAEGAVKMVGGALGGAAGLVGGLLGGGQKASSPRQATSSDPCVARVMGRISKPEPAPATSTPAKPAPSSVPDPAKTIEKGLKGLFGR